MNYKRAIGFALMVYVTTLVLSFAMMPFIQFDPAATTWPMAAWVFNWIVYIPVFLLFAKWFFKKVTPTAKHGLILGVVTILVSVIIDGLFLGGGMLAGQDTGQLIGMYTDWRFYVTILEVVVLTTFAGVEFDATHSAPHT